MSINATIAESGKIRGSVSGAGIIGGSVSGKGALRGDTGGMKILYTDSYAIALANGFEGTVEQWLESLKGEPGPVGAPGPKGDPGTVVFEDLTEEQKASLKGDKGDVGRRGTGVLNVTTAPSSYTTTTGGFKPTYRIALSTVKSQSKAAEVLVGDTLVQSYYTYPVGYVDSSYVYLGTRVSIRGATGAKGSTGAAGAAGKDGVSPTVEVSKSGKVTTIEITDVNGTKIATINDGEDGEGGGSGVGEETEQGGEIFNDENNIANGLYDSASGFNSAASSYVIPLTVASISGSTYTFSFMSDIPAENKTIIKDFVNGGKAKLIAHAPESESEYQCFMTSTMLDNGFKAVATVEQDQFLNPVDHAVGATLWAWFPLCPEAGYYQDTYDMPGYAAHAHGYQNTATGKGATAFGTGTRAAGHSAFAEGAHTYAGIGAHAEGVKSHATGQNSHAEGRESVSSGVVSHAEGRGTTASGSVSHAEGDGAVASGRCAHAEGNATTANGQQSHAEGYSTSASGANSHAEGRMTIASGSGSHAEGNNTIAGGDYQHVEGKYNIEDIDNRYAHIIGGGSSKERKNIYTVDWDGNVGAAGDVRDGQGNSLKNLAALVAMLLEKVSNNIISFSLHYKTYYADQGMTWAQWCESDYNTDGYYVDSNNHVVASERETVSANGTYPTEGTDTINAGGVYYIYLFG